MDVTEALEVLLGGERQALPSDGDVRRSLSRALELSKGLVASIPSPTRELAPAVAPAKGLVQAIEDVLVGGEIRVEWERAAALESRVRDATFEERSASCDAVLEAGGKARRRIEHALERLFVSQRWPVLSSREADECPVRLWTDSSVPQGLAALNSLERCCRWVQEARQKRASSGDLSWGYLAVERPVERAMLGLLESEVENASDGAVAFLSVRHPEWLCSAVAGICEATTSRCVEGAATGVGGSHALDVASLFVKKACDLCAEAVTDVLESLGASEELDPDSWGAHDEAALLWVDEAERLSVRMNRLFPDGSLGVNILQDVAKSIGARTVWLDAECRFLHRSLMASREVDDLLEPLALVALASSHVIARRCLWAASCMPSRASANGVAHALCTALAQRSKIPSERTPPLASPVCRGELARLLLLGEQCRRMAGELRSAPALIDPAAVAGPSKTLFRVSDACEVAVATAVGDAVCREVGVWMVRTSAVLATACSVAGESTLERMRSLLASVELQDVMGSMHALASVMELSGLTDWRCCAHRVASHACLMVCQEVVQELPLCARRNRARVGHIAAAVMAACGSMVDRPEAEKTGAWARIESLFHLFLLPLDEVDKLRQALATGDAPAESDALVEAARRAAAKPVARQRDGWARTVVAMSAQAHPPSNVVSQLWGGAERSGVVQTLLEARRVEACALEELALWAQLVIDPSDSTV
jgi:hypothetical protein